MKLATISAPPAGHVGVLIAADEILDLLRLSGVLPLARLVPPTVRTILEGGDDAMDLLRRCLGAVEAMSNEAQDDLRHSGVIRPLTALTLEAPVPDPHLILSAGLNYRRHLAEMSNTPTPTRPTAFIKAASSLTGPGRPIMVPPQCPDMIDFEGEFTFVFGRECHNVGKDEAMDYVAGYTIANDVSARDWVGEVFKAEGTFPSVQAWERNIMGKQLPTFTPCGPVLVTKDEIADPHNLQLTTRLNGEVMQSTKTDDLIFGVPDLVSYFSQWYRFKPGDLVTTGSPAGVGFGRKPPVFMKAGDIVEVEAEGIGRLVNRLVSAV